MKLAERKKENQQRIRMHDASEKLMRFKNNQIRLCSGDLFFLFVLWRMAQARGYIWSTF